MCSFYLSGNNNLSTVVLTQNNLCNIIPDINEMIHERKKDIFVVIDNRKVTLINHVYCYNLVFEDDEQYFNMVKKFDEVLEAKKQSVEDEMTNNVKNSLKIILLKVKNSPSKP